jgi:hypothetical protein
MRIKTKNPGIFLDSMKSTGTEVMTALRRRGRRRERKRVHPALIRKR